MQRQSLGSPGRGALARNDAFLKADDSRRRDSSPSVISVAAAARADVEDDEIKPEKPLRCHSQPEKLVHLIPILILFCFVVLYLSSHDPSPQDLAQFSRFKHLDKLIVADSTDIDDIGRVSNQLKAGEIFAIRSLRNLQEDIQSDTPKSRFHRKLGDF